VVPPEIFRRGGQLKSWGGTPKLQYKP